MNSLVIESIRCKCGVDLFDVRREILMKHFDTEVHKDYENKQNIKRINYNYRDETMCGLVYENDYLRMLKTKCKCGGQFQYSHYNGHKKTKSHLEFLEKQNA